MDGMRAGYEKLADAVCAVQKGLAEIEATADSPDGMITATVGGRGELLTLTLDPRIYRDPNSAALSRDITATIHDAVERAQRQVFDLVREFLPAGARREEADLDFDPFLYELDRTTKGSR
jgi:DNA-binding protein YbaB